MPDFLDRLGDELRGAAEPGRAQGPARRPRLPRARARLLLIGAAIALLAAGAGALATHNGPTPGPVPPRAGGPLVLYPEREQLEAFAILRRPERSGDPVPLATRAQLSGASGANIAIARRSAGPGASGAWVVPGRGTMCLISSVPERRTGGAACVPAAEALRGRLALVSSVPGSPGSELLAGLVPDGVRAVTVQFAGRPPLSLPVRENVYLGVVPRSVRAVAVHGPHGSARLEGLSLPPSAPAG